MSLYRKPPEEDFLGKEDPCQGCRKIKGKESHLCPLAQELGGDSSDRCNCCKDCTNECFTFGDSYNALIRKRREEVKSFRKFFTLSIAVVVLSLISFFISILLIISK